MKVAESDTSSPSKKLLSLNTTFDLWESKSISILDERQRGTKGVNA